MGEIDLAGVLVFELLQAAARTAVAQAFPFNVGHFLQRLGFPEETLLARRLFGRCGHQSKRSMSGSTKYPFGESFSHKLQVGAISGNSILLRVHPGDQKSERDHWFMTLLGYKKWRVSESATSALGLPHHQRKTSGRRRAACSNAFEPDEESPCRARSSRRDGRPRSGTSSWTSMPGSTPPCSPRARAHASSMSAFRPSWIVSMSAAGSAGSSSSRCRKRRPSGWPG